MKAHRLILSRFASSFAFQILGFFGIYQSYLKTQSALLVGGMGLVIYLPSLLFILGLGSYVDSIKQIGKFYLMVQVLQLFPILGFFFLDSQTSSMMLALFFLSSIRSLRGPVYSSLLKEQKIEVSAIAKWNTLAWQIPAIAAPAMVSYFEINSFSNLVVAMALVLQLISLFLSIEFYLDTKSAQVFFNKNPFQHILDLNILERRARFAPLFVDAIIAAFMALGTYLPFLLSEKAFNPVDAGFYKSMFHLAAFSVVFFVPSRFLDQIPLRSFTYLVFIWALGPIALMFSSTIDMIIFVLLFLGCIDGISTLLRERIIFQYSSSNELGRISSLNSLLIASGDELGEFNSGFMIHTFGVQGGLFFASCVTFLSATGLYLVNRDKKQNFKESLKFN